MNEPVRQHYVPEWYLKGFATLLEGDREPRLWVVNKWTGERRRRGASATAVERHRYTQETPEGRSFGVEKALAEADDDAAEVVRRWVRQSFKRRKGDQSRLAWFAGHLDARGPRRERMTQEFYSAVGTAILRRVAKDPQHRNDIADRLGETDPAEKQAALQRFLLNPEEFLSVSIGKRDAVNEALLSSRDIGLVLESMTLRRLEAPSGSHFLTGDTPVVARVPGPSGDLELLGAGYGDPRVQVCLPLSPQVAILFTHGPTPLDLPKAEFVGVLNGRVARCAEREVYAVDPDAVQSLIAPFVGNSPSPILDRDFLMKSFEDGALAGELPAGP